MQTTLPDNMIDELETEHQHFKIYKPCGFLSRFVPEPRKKKHLLSELADFLDNTMAIGRLDHDSGSLLLLTKIG